MKMNDAFGGQKVKILTGVFKNQIAEMYEPSQKVFGLSVILKDKVFGNQYLDFPASAWNEEHKCYFVEELEALEFKKPAPPKNFDLIKDLEEEWANDKARGTLDD